MTHRVHPKIFRINSIEDWESRGFYEKNQAQYLEEDFKIRKFLKKQLKLAEIEEINIERLPSSIGIIISSARPGLIIGRRGERVTALKKAIEDLLMKKKAIRIEILPIKNPWKSASLSAQWIARRIEKRMAFRRVLKQAMGKITASKKVQGVRIQIAGRLNGVEMSRTEWLQEGKLPRQTLRSDIDYAQTEAFCTYGVIGVKVWIYKGESTAK